jgi:hypothetical protein
MLALSLPAVAQVQKPSADAPAAQTQDATRRLVEGFERSLRGAIDSAASQLTKRVREAIPQAQIDLQFQTEPLVNGVVLPDGSPVFQVLIPLIQDVQQRLIPMMASPRPQYQQGPGATRVAGGSVVEPDSNAPRVPPLTDPNGEYTAFTHAALIDAVLDQGHSVPVPSDKYLTVIAGELIMIPSPFTPRSRFLILQIKGDDLLALRQNLLSREDARAKIKESKY